MVTPTFIALRLLHILAGIIWVGAAFFLARFLMPSLQAAGPAAGPVMQQLSQVRRLPQFLLGAALLTVVSGLALYWSDSGGFQLVWIESGPGLAFTVGAVFGITGMVHGAVVNSPAGRRMGELGAEIQARGGPPDPEQAAEMQRLRATLRRGTLHGAVLLLLAAGLMAVARYLP